MEKIVIAIDGVPAGSGKSYIGDLLAKRLGYVLHISTGIFYRAIGWLADQKQIPLHDIPALQALYSHGDQVSPSA